MDNDLSGRPPIPTEPADGTLAPAPVLLRRAIRTLLGRIGVMLLSFTFAIAIARALSPAGRGDFALLQSLNAFTAVAANFAISGAVIYHVGKRSLAIRKAPTAASAAAFGSGLLGVVVLVPLALLVRHIVLPDIPVVMILAAVGLAAFVLLREYLGGVFIATGRPLRHLAATAIQPTVALLLLMVLVVVNRDSFSGVVFSWGVSVGVSAVAAVVLTFGVVGRWQNFERRDIVALGRFGVRAYPALLARFLNLRLDQFIVRALSSASVLGQYAVAVNVGELLLRIPNQMLWAFSGPISAHRREASASLVAQFCRWALILLLIAALLIAVAAPFLMPVVFGPAYRPAVSSVLFLLPGMVLYAPAIIIAEYFVVQRGRPGRAAAISGSSILVSAILNFPLTPVLGAVGASIASSASYAAMFSIALLMFSRDTGIPVGDVLPRGAADFKSLWRAVRRPFTAADTD